MLEPKMTATKYEPDLTDILTLEVPDLDMKKRTVETRQKMMTYHQFMRSR